jgi:hypothetical protein
MSYLAQYAARRPTSVRRPRRGVRVDERTKLNHPQFCGGAYVRVFVEDTARKRFRRRPPEPRLRLRIADCENEINLEFSVESAARRENSLHKIDTLLAALHRFREGLADEAALYADRQHARANR